MPRPLLLVLACLLVALFPGQGTAAGRFEAQVVELDITWQAWQQRRPWARGEPKTRTASAVVIRTEQGTMLLTTAKAVENATLVRATKHGGSEKHPARLVQVDRAVDLALLTVDEPDFYADLQPARLARRMPSRGTLHSVRWRNRQLELAEGNIARIEVKESRSSQVELLVLTVNTELAGGGSAEPVFRRRELVGLTVYQSDQLARVLPAGIIRSWLEHRQEPQRRFVDLGLMWQVNRDPALNAWLGRDGPASGVLVREVKAGTSACGVLQPRDLLLALDDQPINPDGYYEDEQLGRLRLEHLVTGHHLEGDQLPVQVLRQGEVQRLLMTLRAYPVDAHLIPRSRPDHAPPYLVSGGLVFRELDQDYLGAWGSGWKSSADARLVTAWELEGQAQRQDQRRLVLLSTVLPDPYNIGYHQLRDLVVEQVNGQPIASMEDLARALEQPQGGFQVVRFRPNMQRSELVLDASRLATASERILRAYDVPAPSRYESEPLEPLGCE